MSLCRLECPICQQNLIKTAPNEEAEPESSNSSRNVEGQRSTRRNRSSWSWSPVSTPCGHLFHKGCILQWFRSRRDTEPGFSRLRGSCPTCRKPVAYYNLVRVYLTPSSAAPPDNENFEDATSRPVDTSSSSSSQDRDNELLSSSQSSSRSQLYYEFFNLFQDSASRHDTIRTRLRSRRNRNLSFLHFDCEQQDCIDLRNAFYILSRECRVLQRRLNLELDVSKMKSLLVASQQRDITELKVKRRGSMHQTWLSTAALLALITLWITMSVMIVFSLKPVLTDNDESEL